MTRNILALMALLLVTASATPRVLAQGPPQGQREGRPAVHLLRRHRRSTW